ncbi:MAG: hypothetical protein DLM54_08330, partial [Acidimicrobiales bacterium]
MTAPPRSGQVRPRQGDAKPDQNGERPSSLLVLADGSVFEGEAAGYLPPGGVTTGEVVFNTVLAGYQEVLTDPSYAG